MLSSSSAIGTPTLKYVNIVRNESVKSEVRFAYELQLHGDGEVRARGMHRKCTLASVRHSSYCSDCGALVDTVLAIV
eukprot:20978-Heterococcus_DN1.PRE.2